jgi:nucleoside-diphosphate-sugar epimerase
MKILIVGNMGYIGPSVINQIKQTLPDAELIGFDIGYFAHCLTNPYFLPERKLDMQVFGDVRKFPEKMLDGVDAVLYLAAISNDPMGNKFEEVTLDVNYRSAVDLAKKAKIAGVVSFTYASSCSIYGAASEYPKKEGDELNPLTAYARSKVYTEKELEPLADDKFKITCLRFATACGFTNRMRMDLVLNDFVAGALINREINILSDGTPWRPMINTKDMARAFEWGILRDAGETGNYLTVNTGSNEWNNQIRPLAEAVAKIIPGTRVTINREAASDKRSYRVNFDLYKKLAPDHQPVNDLESTINELKDNMIEMNFNDPNYRASKLVRLHVLNDLIARKYLNTNLEWK